MTRRDKQTLEYAKENELSSDLFDFHEKNNDDQSKAAAHFAHSAPLAHLLRPESLDQFVGHHDVVGPKGPLRKWIAEDRVPSLVFWGPPGCGKTTLAQIVAKTTRSRFVSMSAVLAGVKDIKEEIKKAKFYLETRSAQTIVFLDEIHRFNKAQQDALLPHVEAGTIQLIGATTENPSFELNSALLSRLRVLRLNPLDNKDIQELIDTALLYCKDKLQSALNLSESAITWLSQSAQGDARRALTTIETLLLTLTPNRDTPYEVEEIRETLSSNVSYQPIHYDKNGEEHYNVISAFIKSIRDSDPHAGLYYLARMLEAGEDPKFIVRRLIILASEDIGNADPRALQVAVAAKDALDFVGMPECRINLAQAVTYLASVPKSNASYLGIDEALAEVKKSGSLAVPMHLRNAVTGLMKREGYGKGYQYAHNNSGAKVTQHHLPEELRGKRYYRPKESGLEIQIKESLDKRNSDFD